MNWLIKKIVLALIARCERKRKFFNILGNSEDPTDVYLVRYFVLQSKYCNIYLHRFLRSDRDDLHDHPWNFATYLVDGAYSEVTPNGTNRRTNYTDGLGKRVKQNTLVFRKATDKHQVKVDRDFRYYERRLAPLTLFISGPVKRDWGFWVNGVWTHWQIYLNKQELKKEPWA